MDTTELESTHSIGLRNKEKAQAENLRRARILERRKNRNEARRKARHAN
jgi:hypothetical protein